MNPDKNKADDKFNKYTSIALLIVIIFAIGVYAYTHFVEKEQVKSDDETPTAEETPLTVSIGSDIFNYSFDDLISMSSVTGKGAYINRIGKITGPNNYTGVSVSALLNYIEEIPDNYTVHAIASDGYDLNYSIDEINGHVSIFNETGNETGIGNLTTIIAYKENGVLLDEDNGGPLRIVFVDDEGSITHSSLWLRSLVRMEII